MHTTESGFIDQLIDWLEQGKHVLLFTVISTWGSSPRPPGSLLAMCQTGEFMGSVSGGCIEHDLLERVQSGEFDKRPFQFIEYGVNADTARHFGLPCGGNLRLLVETRLQLPQFLAIRKALSNRSRLSRRLCLNTGEISLHPTTDSQLLTADEQAIQRIFGPAWRLLIIGAGDLTQRLIPIADMLDYDVTVCDPREEYIHNWPYAHIPVNRSMPDDLVKILQPDAGTAVITLAHDPKLDDLALLEALTSDAFYVGALGSSRTSQQRRERLSGFGISQQQLDKLHGPIGLDIGSRTPAEIAVSIMAGITAARHHKILLARK